MAAAVGRYSKDVEAFLRCSKRMGLKHRPRTVVEVMLLDHEQRGRQIKALEGIEDVLRLQVGCPFFFFFLSVSDFRLLGGTSCSR